MAGPFFLSAAWRAEARAEQRDNAAVAMVDWDDIDGRGERSLVRLRTVRFVRIGISVAATVAGWALTPYLPGLLPIIALALCCGGAISTVLTVVLLVHVQRAIRAVRYEASFGPHD